MTGQTPPDPSGIRTLVLKGGGVKGLAFAGAIQELNNAGYSFNTFVGTSAGSIAAVLFAAGFSAHELEQLLRGTDFAQFQDAGFTDRWKNLLIFGGLYPGDRLRTWVEECLRQRFPSTLPIIEMGALRQHGNRAIVFASHPRLGTLTFDSHGANRETEVSYAVRLSSSIPLWFVPGSYNGHRIYDGGLLNNFPVEAYQQICQEEQIRSAGTDSADTVSDLRPDQPPAAGVKDFLALYLGKQTEIPVRKNWLSEVLGIMLSQDDTLQLSRNADRSIVIDVEPIGVTDFNLSDTEKRYLLASGRLAARQFLGDDDTRELAAEVRSMRSQIERVRETDRLGRNLRRLAAAALLVVVALGAREWLKTTPPMIVDEKIAHAGTYIDHRAMIQPLSKGAFDDLRATHLNYVGFQKDALLFNSALQVVFLRGKSAFKVMVYEGQVDEGYLKATASNIASSDVANQVRADGFLFRKEGRRWNPIDVPWATNSGGDDRNVLKELRVPNHFLRGAPIRFITLASYSDAYPVDEEAAIPVVDEESLLTTEEKPDETDASPPVEGSSERVAHALDRSRPVDSLRKPRATRSMRKHPPRVAAWTLLAHRLVKPEGETTYLFLGDTDPHANVDHVVPHRVYVKTKPERYRLVELPPNNEGLAWAQCQKLLGFLEETTDPDHERFKSLCEDTVWKQLIENGVVAQLHNAIERRRTTQESSSFAFLIDGSNHQHGGLDLTPETNLVVFVQEP